MKLYKTKYTINAEDEGGGTLVSTWAGSADEASKGRTALKAAHPGCKPTTEPFDVPADKTGLLAWLNTNAV